VILYNVPSRTVADLHNDTVVRLAGVKNIVGIKESTSNIERITDLMMRVPDDFLVFSGNDDAALAYVLLGADGVISVTANVAPRLMHDMCVAAKRGENAKAIEINNRLLGLHQHLFVETNPIPVKWALTRMGRIAEGIRLPLTPLAPHHHETVAAALRGAGCLN
jgi:4-hydroxy-tetrahydrodipicolinate synthase